MMFALKKTAMALAELHKSGYVHLDVKPENMLYFKDGYIKMIDTDSIIKKEKFKDDAEPKILSYSEGYTAPEIVNYRGTGTDCFTGEENAQTYTHLVRYFLNICMEGHLTE